MVGNIQTEGRQPVPFTQPVNVVQDVAIAGGDVRRRARAGEAHLAAIAEESEALLDIEHTALPVPRRGQRALRLRHELLAAVFVGGHWSKSDLPPPLNGLWAEAFSDHVECLESLRLLLLRWPGCPDALKTQEFRPATPVDDGLKLERAVVKFYCECAFQQFGRAAALPRVVPPSLRAV